MSGLSELPEPRIGPASSVDFPAKRSEDVASNGTLRVLEETLEVSKRDVGDGVVRVSTRTETRDEIAEVTLDHGVVDVDRIPIGRIVEVAPDVRIEGDTTIVPVVEERFVVVKQLYLTEELHIRHRVEQTVTRVPVQLRKQRAVVERLDAGGEPVADPLPSPS